ncbi:MAG: nucleotidyl transferase AbiEii/AbiGii toxin family protein, partial [Nocardioidaceae bacterium]
MSTSDTPADHPLAYATPAAFRAGLKARFAAIARADPRYTLTELQRQFAYDRVLARCFTSVDRDLWVLKGAGALLARLDANARHSKDIDLYYAEHATAADDAVHALRAALDRDLGDYFTFEITSIGVLQEVAKGRRLHLTAMLGPKPYASFHVDVVVDTAMTGRPDPVAPLTPLQLEGLARPAYRAFPLPDHIADKLLAICETHVQAGQTRVSSRVKDLVDIGLIASTHRL